MPLLLIILSITLTALGFFHFYWAIGGTVGFAQSLPTKENGERVLNPTKIDCIIVGLGLSACGAFYLLTSSLIEPQFPNWITTYAGWIIPIPFLLRAIGDFNYVGFFKRITNTEFGKLDTKYFSPLCLAIGIGGLILELMK